MRVDHIAHVQQITDPDLQTGLLGDFPLQGLLDRLAGLDLPARQRPRPVAFGVLVQQQDPVILDHDCGNAHIHWHLPTVATPADQPTATRPHPTRTGHPAHQAVPVVGTRLTPSARRTGQQVHRADGQADVRDRKLRGSNQSRPVFGQPCWWSAANAAAISRSSHTPSTP